MKTIGKDHSITVRVSPELLSKVQAKVASVAALRAKHPTLDAASVARREAYPATISGLIRKAVETYFEISDDPRDYLLSNHWDLVADEVRAALATAVHDDKARKVLQRLAKRELTEADFE